LIGSHSSARIAVSLCLGSTTTTFVPFSLASTIFLTDPDQSPSRVAADDQDVSSKERSLEGSCPTVVAQPAFLAV
jgi:hypothetical protein